MYNYLSIPIKDFRASASSSISRDLNKPFKFYDYSYPYTDRLVSNCKIFYICLPDNSFIMNFATLKKLSPGCYRELMFAINLGKEIRIIYKTKLDNVYKEYNTEISDKSISGISNCKKNINEILHRSISEISSSKKSTNVPNLIQPQTILLLNV